MLTPGPCPLCRRWVDDLPAGGLCPACAAGGWTATADPAPPTTADAATAARVAAARAATPDPPPGYDLLDRLGAGGMGLVYQARERATDRLVAVKYIHAVTHPTARDRFRVEAQALARVQHPNVVPVYAVALDGREPYFTMEYLPGGTLARRLAAGPLPFPAAARVVGAVARGVEAAHAVGVLHRDLKPSNVLIAADGTPKVVDFGLAKCADRDDGLTGSGSLVGTPNYMAPEQAAYRHAEVGPAADVYSLGAVLYECLTGRPPFKGPDPAATARMVVSQHPAAPRAVRPDCPRDLEAVCLKCLEKDPRKRYASADDLADDLDRFLAGESTAARPLAWPRRAWRHLRRQPAATAAAVLIPALLAAAVPLVRDRDRAAGAEWPASPADPPPDPDDAPDAVVEDYRAALRAGRPVTLIGDGGRPRWYRWGLRGGLFVPPAGPGAALAVKARDECFLELLPDPGIDHYRVTAELRHEGNAHLLPAGGADGPRVGVYVGRAVAPGPHGVKAHAVGIAQFTDAAAGRDPAGEPRPVMVRYGDRLLFDGPLPLAGLYRELGAARVDPPPGLPGPWRTIAITVARDRVAVTADGKLVARHDPETLKARDEGLQTDANLRAPDGRAALAAWSSRAPLGLWVGGAQLGVRTVVVTPVPALPECLLCRTASSP